MANSSRLSLALIRREINHGSLRLFLLALALSVASMLSVTLVADRLNQAITLSGRDYIGADRVIIASRTLQEDVLKAAQTHGLELSRTQSFQSVLFAGDELQLASVRAVDNAFPFYGELQLSPPQALAKGQIWLSARLLALLKVDIGSTVELGNLKLKVTGELVAEPDQSLSPALLAPRALIHLDDVAASGIQMAGSRVNYRYLFKGSAQALDDYQAWLTPQLALGQRWQDASQANSPVSRSLARAEQFFRLASLIGVLLGMLAMAIALGYFSKKEQDRIALLKTLGASRRFLLRWLSTLLGSLLLLGVVVGTMVGYGLHKLILLSLGQALQVPLPPPSWQPFAYALGLAVITTIILALMPMRRLLQVPALKVLRNEAEAHIPVSWSVSLLLLATFLLSWLFSGEAILAGALLLGLLSLMAILGAVSGAMLWIARHLGRGIAFKLALNRLQRARISTLLQFGGVALALFLGCLLWIVRAELVDGFLANLPEKAPNRFVINIAEDELASLRHMLDEARLTRSVFYPIVRGRLVAINEQATAEDVDNGEAQGVGRELNLTYSRELPKGNRILKGQWTQAPNSVSVEAGLAKRLNIKLGDNLQLDLAGGEVKGQVKSIREVDWDSMQPNFYLIFSPDVLASYSPTWLASFYLPKTEQDLEIALIRAFPTVTILDVEALLQQLRHVLAQVSQALLVIMALVILASLLVLLAQLETTLDSRRRELVLLRTLGASERLLQASLRWEWLAAGLAAGLAAALGVELCVAILLPQWLGLPWQPHPGLWLGLPALGAGLLLLTGRVGGVTRPRLMTRLRQW